MLYVVEGGRGDSSGLVTASGADSLSIDEEEEHRSAVLTSVGVGGIGSDLAPNFDTCFGVPVVLLAVVVWIA